MVKRTLLVLSIVSLILMMVGTSFAMFGGGRAAGGWCGLACAPPPPVYCPVDCPPYPVPTTVVKKWNCKIVTPYVPVAAPVVVVSGRRGRRLGLIGGLANAVMTPFDVIFGGRGVFGCRIRNDGPCGPFFGPVPAAVVAIPRFFAAPTTGVFGGLW